MRINAYGTGLLALLFVSAVLVAGCGKQEEPPSGAGVPTQVREAATGAPSAGEAEIAQKLCPIMGGAIDKNIYVDYEGRRIYFCCQACVDTFQKDPKKYLDKLDAQLRAVPETGGSHE